MTSNCRVCQKPLTTLLSQTLGVGPVCRVLEKNASARTERDMFSQADFIYEVRDDVLLIEDLNQGGISVTNDIENVLQQIQHDLGAQWDDLALVIYCDSTQLWDGVKVNGKRFDSFYALHTYDFQSAITKARSLMR